MPNNKGAIAEGKKNLLACLSHLNSYLASKTFLCGERPSAADAAVVASLSLAFKQVLAPEYRKNCPHVVRWFQTCVHKMPAFGAHQLAKQEAKPAAAASTGNAADDALAAKKAKDPWFGMP